MNQLPDKFPDIATSRLALTALKPAHAGRLFQLFTDKQVIRYYNVLPLKEEKDAEKVIHYLRQRFIDKLGIRWAITLKGTDEFIGTIGFNNFPQPHRGVIVYAIEHQHWGKGFMTEAIQALVRYGFHDLELIRIEAEVLPGNSASERVLAKNGFKQEGMLHKWLEWGGDFFDVNMWALVKA
ncbi:GNAT family N-acetyltransferase [Chitinophaga sp. Mgbs1]|uniref:GNAT family N-acetyltransferase n=1 Tax=Chitinophaga solisilvae TaxID=1233460 RepID=A0A433WN56_9BACT|nr:GNAT family N-acetyltransferase [Chitinophaga solisilvae]